MDVTSDEPLVTPDETSSLTVFRTLRFAVSGLSSSSHVKLSAVFALMNDLYNAAVEEHRARLREYRVWRMGGGLLEREQPDLSECCAYETVDGERRVAVPACEWARPEFRSYYDDTKLLTLMRREDADLAALSLQVERGELKKFHDNQQRRLAHGGGKPRFRSWQRHRSLFIGDPSDGMVQRPAAGGKWTRLRVKSVPTLKFDTRGRLLDDDQIKALRVVRLARRYEVHVVVARTVDVPEHDGLDVGVDLGVKARATMSDGTTVERRDLSDARRNVRRLHRRVDRATQQRKRDRRQERSAGERKKREHLRRAHERLRERNVAEDHRITTQIVRRYRNIAVEDLSIQRMLADNETPIPNINRDISEQAWGRFVEQLTYKAESAGGRVVKVDPKHTSQDCSYCGAKQANTSSTYSTFACSACDTRADRDVNAARNVYLRAARSDTGGKTPWRAVEAQNLGIAPGARRTLTTL